MMMKTTYKFTPEMREISGFGRSYETTCRKMVVAGAKWLEENLEAKVAFSQYQNVYGMTFDESEDCKKLEKVMLKAAKDDCTGAMMQTCLNHVMFIKTNGWEKYVEEMTTPLTPSK